GKQMLFGASAFNKLPWKCAGMRSTKKDLGAIDPYLIDALGKLQRIVKGGFVFQCFGIEEY
ncbi:MAG: hypothetical protein ACO32O_08475, partial [Ilumatobacteraceae bacterium]